VIYDISIGVVLHDLETRESNPYSLDPKSNALPVKLVSIIDYEARRLEVPLTKVLASYKNQ
jgi:hypothetical protein